MSLSPYESLRRQNAYHISPRFPTNRTRYAIAVAMRVLTSTVELQSRLESDPLLGSASLGISLLSSVQSIDVGLVVLLVVKLHDLTTDERLESIVRVREVWENVGHDACLV